MILTRDHFAALKAKVKSVVLPALNGSTFVRELKAAEVVAYGNLQKTDPMSAIYYAIKVATVNEAGQQLFQDGDEEIVAGLPYKVMEAITDAVLDITGLKPTPAVAGEVVAGADAEKK